MESDENRGFIKNIGDNMKLRREEDIKFERDSKGKVIQIHRTGDIEKPKITDPEKLKKQEAQQHRQMEKQHMKRITRDYKQKQAKQKALKRVESKKKWQPVKKAIRTSMDVSRKTMATSRETMKLGKPLKLTTPRKTTKKKGSKNYVIRKGVAYPIAQKKKTQKKKKKEGDFNWNDSGMLSWKDLMK